MDISFEDILDISGMMDEIMSDEPEESQAPENTQSHNDSTDQP